MLVRKKNELLPIKQWKYENVEANIMKLTSWRKPWAYTVNWFVIRTGSVQYSVFTVAQRTGSACVHLLASCGNLFENAFSTKSVFGLVVDTNRRYTAHDSLIAQVRSMRNETAEVHEWMTSCSLWSQPRDHSAASWLSIVDDCSNIKLIYGISPPPPYAAWHIHITITDVRPRIIYSLIVFGGTLNKI